MDCPKCKAEMEPVNFSGIEVDRCTGCKGIWFDRGEKELMKDAAGSEAIDSQSESTTEGYEEINCPKCQSKMTVNTKDLGEKHLTYETCMGCGGSFFDPGEFEDFKNDDSWQNAFSQAFANL